MRKFRDSDALPLPPDLDYNSLTWVSAEERLLLSDARPTTVHAAGRVPGMSCHTA